MNYEDLTDLFQGNDVFYLSWTNESSDPRRLSNAFIDLHSRDVHVHFPLTQETVPTLVTLIKVSLEEKACVLFTYDIKDLMVSLRHSLQSQGWQPRVEWPAKLFDLCYLERFAGCETKKPQSLSEMRVRFKKVYDKDLFSLHRELHIPLATRTLPRMEGLPLLKVGEGQLFSHYVIEGQTYGRLNCDKPASNYCTPQNLSDPDISPGKEHQVFLLADYHAMEVAVLQKVSSDRRLARILEQPDVYEAIGRYLFGCSKEEAASNRQMIKKIFLPVMYGMSPPGIGRTLNVSTDFAEQIFNEVHAKFPEASSCMLDIEQKASSRGKEADIMGRVRNYPTNPKAARNGAIQGPGAMHCEIKLVELADSLDGVADVVASIHDGYLAACHPSEIHQAAAIIRSVLESESRIVPGLKLRSRVAVGKTLGSMEKYVYQD